ncbi:MAG: transposase zinc-binding domain-containing protein [Planctomycetota bacterium]
MRIPIPCTHEFGDDYLDQARRGGGPPDRLARQEHVLRDLMACRTAAMGEHEWRCDTCGQTYVHFNSCANRHCPQWGHSCPSAWNDRVLISFPQLPHRITAEFPSTSVDESKTTVSLYSGHCHITFSLPRKRLPNDPAPVR